MFSELVLCRKLFPIRYCCHRSDHELKVGAHIQAINMSGHDDGIQCSNGLGTILDVAKEPIFASDLRLYSLRTNFSLPSKKEALFLDCNIMLTKTSPLSSHPHEWRR